MHNLLARQINKYFGKDAKVPEEAKAFVAAVNDAYEQADADRVMLERSLEISSEELLRANAELRAISQASPDLFFRFDSQGKIIDFSSGSSRDLYAPPAEFIGKIISNVLPQPVAEQTMAAIRKVLESKSLVTFEYDLPMPDGVKSFEARLFPLHGEQVEAMVRNITERKRAEEKYQTIISASIDGFWLADLKGKFLDTNDAYCRMVGFSRDELFKMRIQDVEVIEKPEETAARIKKIAEQGSDCFESKHRRKDGQIIDVEISVNYLQSGEGVMAVFIRDITERKRAEDELKEKMHDLEEFHDLTVGREMKMIELEKELEKLKADHRP